MVLGETFFSEITTQAPKHCITIHVFLISAGGNVVGMYPQLYMQSPGMPQYNQHLAGMQQLVYGNQQRRLASCYYHNLKTFVTP